MFYKGDESLKHQQLFVLMQPETENSFWADHIRNGIRDGVREWNDTVCTVDLANPPPMLNEQYVLVVGSNIDWLQSSIIQLIHKGVHPIIVNACMLPVRQFRCSGVVFELEEMLDKCLKLLHNAGRKNTILLGTNPHSVSDHVKAEAFTKASSHLQTENIIWAEGSLDLCISDFAEKLPGSEWDSVICANDTAAVCLSRCLTSNGYQLPDDLYIIGIGNSYVGASIRNALTSVMFDYYQMGVTAVRLYHNLLESPTPCHSIVSLPCRLIIRNSAPVHDVSSLPDALPITPCPSGTYFESDVIQNIIKVESILQSGDHADREILFGILHGESCDTIADKLFFSSRTVRYRLKKLLKQYGFENRTALENAFRCAVGEANPSEGEYLW